jgi:hypothetical protein
MKKNMIRIEMYKCRSDEAGIGEISRGHPTLPYFFFVEHGIN